VIDFLLDSDTLVIVDPADAEAKKQSLTHNRLKRFVLDEFDLSQFGIMERDRVSVLIPNGAIVAVTIVALLHRWCVAPISPASTFLEIRDELLSTKSRCIIILKNDPVGKIAMKAAEEVNIGVLVLTPNDSTPGLFTMESVREINKDSSIPKPSIIAKSTVKVSKSSKHPETVLLLHTSGTSGNKKLVPYSLDMIVIGVSCIIKSWNLTESDVCLNMVSNYILLK
jgi:acyl-coenzyme A synthetase/AMP-(fatty) acid ligase